MTGKWLLVADLDEVKSGLATDVYFTRTKRILVEKGLHRVRVKAEIHNYGLPRGYEWAVFTGLEEALRLLEGLPVNVWSVPEGTVFKERCPLMRIEGCYADFCLYETPLLGILRHSTSISTRAARVKRLAGDKKVLFFGLRALHPAIYPMVDRAAYIGGCDAVSGVLAEKYLGLKPVGTMPHALIIVFGDQVSAWKAFDEVIEPSVPRIALADTFSDERFEALMAAKALGERLYGVRFDTPSSRRGSMRMIVEEARWALDLEGYEHVKIFVSGGISERQVVELRDVVEGFGVGTSIAMPPAVDLAMDIVEVERDGAWRPLSKRGKLPGAKQFYRCPNHPGEIKVTPWGADPPECDICGATMEGLMVKYMEDGKIIRRLPSVDEIRSYVLSQVFKLPEPEPRD